MSTVARFLIPHREWFVVFGGLIVRHAPEVQRRWVWFGEPLSIVFDGIGPFRTEREAAALLNATPLHEHKQQKNQ